MKVPFIFASEGDRELAVSALDWLHQTANADARNVNLADDVRRKAADRAADADRIAREIENLAQIGGPTDGDIVVGLVSIFTSVTQGQERERRAEWLPIAKRRAEELS